MDRRGGPFDSDVWPPLKQKALHEAREFVGIALYLFVVFSLFEAYKSVILAEYHLAFALHELALINALALAKVILVAQELHLADRFRDAPLIYPTLLKSFVFTIVLACFKIAEEAGLGHDSRDMIIMIDPANKKRYALRHDKP